MSSEKFQAGRQAGYNACLIRGQSYATRSRKKRRERRGKRTERKVTRPVHGNNRGDRIRTYGPLYPKQMRYQTALHLVLACLLACLLAAWAIPSSNG